MLRNTVAVLALAGVAGVWLAYRSQALRRLTDRMLLGFLEQYSHFEAGSQARPYDV